MHQLQHKYHVIHPYYMSVHKIPQHADQSFTYQYNSTFEASEHYITSQRYSNSLLYFMTLLLTPVALIISNIRLQCVESYIKCNSTTQIPLQATHQHSTQITSSKTHITSEFPFNNSLRREVTPSAPRTSKS